MIPVLYYFQLKILTYPYPVDTPDTSPEPQPTVIDGNQDQPEDKQLPGATLCSYVQMHAKLLLFYIIAM